MVLRRLKLWTFEGRVALVVPEPVLAGLEAADYRVSGGFRVLRRVLARRGVAAADVPAQRTPPQVKPPPVRRRQTLDTACPARRHGRINPFVYEAQCRILAKKSRASCRLVSTYSGSYVSK